MIGNKLGQELKIDKSGYWFVLIHEWLFNSEYALILVKHDSVMFR